mgnify:CR=1 FL=1|tara:strand:- start:8192 stop:8428 length:237 start_codon:yes stop_codon:yes gene_type:complete
MYSYLFGHYFYEKEIYSLIEKVEVKRRKHRLDGTTMRTTFAEDLKNLMMGIEDVIIKDCPDCINKADCSNCKMEVIKK